MYISNHEYKITFRFRQTNGKSDFVIENHFGVNKLNRIIPLTERHPRRANERIRWEAMRICTSYIDIVASVENVFI